MTNAQASMTNDEHALNKTRRDSGNRSVAIRPEGTSEVSRWSAHRNHKPHEPDPVMTNRAAIEPLPAQRLVCRIHWR
jgi:hypothetical protein